MDELPRIAYHEITFLSHAGKFSRHLMDKYEEMIASEEYKHWSSVGYQRMTNNSLSIHMAISRYLNVPTKRIVCLLPSRPIDRVILGQVLSK